MHKIFSNIPETFAEERSEAGFVIEIFERLLSLGAVTYLSALHPVEEMIGATDRIMYKVKNAGKNSITHESVG